MGVIYLVRHAATALDESSGSGDRITGWSEAPLEPAARDEALRVAQQLAGNPICEILSSDLSRAYQTATLMAKPLNINYVKASKDWRPWNLGLFKGEPERQVDAQIQAYQRSAWTQIPGGESFLSFFRRFTNAMRHLMQFEADSDEEAVVVTHSVNICLLDAWLRAHRTENPMLLRGQAFRCSPIAPGQIAKLSPTPGGDWKLSWLGE